MQSVVKKVLFIECWIRKHIIRTPVCFLIGCMVMMLVGATSVGIERWSWASEQSVEQLWKNMNIRCLLMKEENTWTSQRELIRADIVDELIADGLIDQVNAELVTDAEVILRGEEKYSIGIRGIGSVEQFMEHHDFGHAEVIWESEKDSEQFFSATSPACLITRSFAETGHLEIGDIIEMIRTEQFCCTEVRVAGILDHAVLTESILLPEKSLEQMTGHETAYYGSVAFSVAPEKNMEYQNVAEIIRKRIQRYDVQLIQPLVLVVADQEVQNVIIPLNRKLEMIMKIRPFLYGFLMLLFGCISGYICVLRRKDISIMKNLGTERSIILWLIIGEAGLSFLTGAVIAVSLAILLGVKLSYTVWLLAGGIVLSEIVMICGSLYAIRRKD